MNLTTIINNSLFKIDYGGESPIATLIFFSK